MFSKLPDLFERNFAVGFFLPIAAFLAASVYLLNGCDLLQTLWVMDTASQFGVLVGTTFIGLASWLGGVFLMVTNRAMIRFLEGYGRFNPLRLFHSLEKYRYRRLKEQISELDDEYRSCLEEKKDVDPGLRSRRARLRRQIVTRFPDDERWVLPTPFGNIIRAFEVYPRVMYGLDSIPGWHRLIMVMPEEYRNLIDDAKVQVDFWVNLCFLSLAILIEYLGVVSHLGELELLWFPSIALGTALVSVTRAQNCAIEWGHLVKSGFDIFLPSLRESLGFSSPNTMDDERLLWRSFSQAVIYARPDCFPDRDGLQNGN